MRKKAHLIMGCLGVCLLARTYESMGQLSLTGQLRTRTEIRDGYGTLETLGNKPAFLTSQRARLNLNYRSSRVVFQMILQDVRVWGADASTISSADGSRLGVHEAWAEVMLANARDSSLGKSGVAYFGVRIGRQELVYDDQRLLGNLDWLQQGRRHDAVVLKFSDKGWQADLGAAFNQNGDGIGYSGTYYTPANVVAYVKDSKGNLAATPSGMVPLVNGSGVSARNGSPALSSAAGTNGMNQDYKSMQFLYVAKKFNRTTISGLVFADEFGKYNLDSVENIAGSDTGFIYGRRFNRSGVNARLTAGGMVVSEPDSRRHWSLQAGYYYQTGRNKDGGRVSAYTSTLGLTYKPGRFAWTAGWDWVSAGFDPLYGTPHKFWGSMDYFYAASGAPAGGLNNPFFKMKYKAGGRFTAGLDYHYFALAGEQRDGKGNVVSKYLGSEADALLGYSLNKIVGLEGGFSLMRASASMDFAKGLTPGTTRREASWAYLQVNIKPDFFSK